MKATLKLVPTGVGPANTAQGFRIGLFNFADSSLSPKWLIADGFAAGSQGNGVQGYSQSLNMGTAFNSATYLYLYVRTNLASASLQGTTANFQNMGGTIVSNNFPGFSNGRQYILTLTITRTDVGSVAFGSSWLDTVTGGTISNCATNTAATCFRFDGFALRSQGASSSATNITLNEFKVDYIPAATTGMLLPTNAAIYYTLDGSLPTQGSILYAGAIDLATSSVVRAVAFATNWAPSPASVAYYGFPPAGSANAQVTCSISTSSPSAPVVSFNVVPGTNAVCVAVMESLPPGVGAINISSGGNYVASNNMVLWGPFIGSNVLSLSYQAVGQPGVYPVQSFWSVDGVGASDGGTNLVIGVCT